MTEFGHVKISRKAYQTDRFWNEPREFSKWEAWEWMIQEAAWKDYQRATGITTVQLARGEFIASIQFLAKAWMWTPKRVRGFLESVIGMERIKSMRETHFGTVYLLVNYERYQDNPKGSVTIGAQQGHEKGQRKGTDRGTEKPSEVADDIENGARNGARLGAQSRSEKGTKEKQLRRKREGGALHPLPPDWEPTAEHIRYCTENRIDLAFEAEKFRLHAEQKAVLNANWNAAFSIWIRKDWVKRLNGHGVPKFAPIIEDD